MRFHPSLQMTLRLQLTLMQRETSRRLLLVLIHREQRQRLQRSPHPNPNSSVHTDYCSCLAKGAWEKCGWRSRRSPIHRTVALKLIKAGMDTKARGGAV